MSPLLIQYIEDHNPPATQSRSIISLYQNQSTIPLSPVKKSHLYYQSNPNLSSSGNPPTYYPPFLYYRVFLFPFNI